MLPFSHVIQGENLYFRHSYGVSVRNDREFHPFHEIVYFLHGNTLFLSDSVSRMMEEKTLVFIPKETYHQFSFLSDPEDYHRCVFQFYDSPPFFTPPAGSMREIRFLPSCEGMEYAVDLLVKQAERAEREKRSSRDDILLVQAVLLVLLYGAAGRWPTEGTVSVLPGWKRRYPTSKTICRNRCLFPPSPKNAVCRNPACPICSAPSFTFPSTGTY